MTKLLKTAAIAALITGFANTAHAGSSYAFQSDEYLAMAAPAPITDAPFVLTPMLEAAIPAAFTEEVAPTPRIAVARLDGGRLIPTPYGEEFDGRCSTSARILTSKS